MDKLRMQSSNGVEDNITKIAQLFPDCVTETVDERSGQPKHLIDFEKLKQNLSDSVRSERAERYQFIWPDKSKAILLDNSPTNAESNGRFHTDWLNMIYPRLKVA